MLTTHAKTDSDECGGSCTCCSRRGPRNSRERMLAALRQTRVDRPPVWFMRQAGRHMPKYRAIRERLSFLELCRDAEANAVVSAEPLLRYGLDAAIVFNDILTPLRDMGMKLDFDPGPRFGRLIDRPDDVARLALPDYGASTDVSRCVAALRGAVGEEHAVLGFIGAPFTVAAFAIAGSGPQRTGPIGEDIVNRRALYVAMQERLLPVLVSYATAQVSAGADVIQLFESLAHDAGDAAYRDVGLSFLVRTVHALRGSVPQTPIIVFGRGLWHPLVDIARAGASAVSLDETARLSTARRALHGAGLSTSLQGNLRPEALLGTPQNARAEAASLLDSWRTIVPHPGRADDLGPTGWVFNLGHGVPASADPNTVQAVVDAVKAFGDVAQRTKECTP